MNKYLIIKGFESKLNNTILDFIKGMVGFVKIKYDEDLIIVNYDNYELQNMKDALESLLYDLNAQFKFLIVEDKNEEEFNDVLNKIKPHFNFELKDNVYDLKEFIFENVEYSKEFKELILKNFIYDYDFQNAIKKFIENNMNVLKTSKILYMHRNTLINKLDRFNQITGYDPKEFKDAYVLYTILK